MVENNATSGWPTNRMQSALAVVHTAALVGILVALALIYQSLGSTKHILTEQFAPTIAQGPWPWVRDGSTLESVTLERLGDVETIPIGERRAVIGGEWMNVSRYSERFEQVTDGGRERLIRKSVWVHIPSRTRITLTYANPKQADSTPAK